MRSVVIVLIMMLLACGCSGGTSNGTSNLNDPIPTAVFTAGGLGLFAGEPAALTVGITAGTPPYTVEINMGGGADNVPAGTGVDATSTHDLILAEGGPFTYYVTVTDRAGRTGTCSGDYGPVGPARNHPPTVTDIAFTGGVLAVAVDDPDGDDPLTVSVAEVPGLIPSVLEQQVANEGAALFNYRLIEGFDPADLDVTVTVSDGQAESTASTAPTGSVPLVEVPEGSLAAIPLVTHVAIDEPVTVVVITGDFPTDRPFQHMNGIGIKCQDGFDTDDHTLNAGAAGGERKAPDGIWAQMDPVPGELFIPEDFMMIWTIDLTEDPAFDFFCYTISAIGGSEITEGGMLFNIPLTFGTAGEYNLGFVEFQDVKRTYYSDADGDEYNWNDISNDIPGLPNTITVVK